MIRNAVIRGLTAQPNEFKTPERNRLEAQSLNALNEYSLVKAGAASYESLGYEVPDQGVMAFKLYEYLVISEAVEQAQRDKK